MTPAPSSSVVVVGASAGAVDALSVLLPALPAQYPFAVAVVVHLPPDRKSVMAELFQPKCRVRVKEAEDKEPFVAGTVYFAPPDYHLMVEPDGRLSLSSEEPVLYSRPSIDVLFETAADALGPAAVGVVLTGGSADGARGLRAIADAGGVPLVQDPSTAAVPAMPEAALAACPTAAALPLDRLAEHLARLGAPS
jgi:two-component system chemotaxis response regulator CheB